MFASLNFNIAGVALPPVDPAECVRLLPDLSAGLLLFDILIANPDRHGTNFSLNTLAQPAQMNVFDQGCRITGEQWLQLGVGVTRGRGRRKNSLFAVADTAARRGGLKRG